MGFFENVRAFGLAYIGDDLAEYFNGAVDYVAENPVKSVLTVVAGVATGGVAWAAAPTIAATVGGLGVLGTTATTGAVISELTGVALANASLAAIGGGALSTGGLGMAGGAVVVAAAGGTAGAAIIPVSTVVKNKFTEES
ncbi:hypothetical protein [Enterobacter ludwigii]|uniref:hypothetical protein n=1 Tax=Enterobacter ludwigii TaxID=299767 RepID=UPI00069A3D0B|nr:hypothetical protein [Enterobacter ludwigii]